MVGAMEPTSNALIKTASLTCRQPQHIHQHIRHCRPFSSSIRCMINPLQNLSHFSAAKEAQFLSKEKRIPREEFHPYLQLIRSSEVDPFAPVPGASPTVVAALKHAKTGEADTDSALRLAVSNLIDQVQVSRRETADVLRALVQVQERYKREERNALLMLFTTLGLLAFVMLKTRAFEDMLDYVGGVRNEWDSFDWQCLGHSSGRLPTPREIRALLPAKQNIPSSENVAPSPEQSRTKILPDSIVQPLEVECSSHPQPESRSLMSRLFWASSSN